MIQTYVGELVVRSAHRGSWNYLEDNLNLRKYTFTTFFFLYFFDINIFLPLNLPTCQMYFDKFINSSYICISYLMRSKKYLLSKENSKYAATPMHASLARGHLHVQISIHIQTHTWSSSLIRCDLDECITNSDSYNDLK